MNLKCLLRYVYLDNVKHLELLSNTTDYLPCVCVDVARLVFAPYPYQKLLLFIQ